MDYGRKFVKFPNKYSEQNVLNKVFIFENYESAYDLGSDLSIRINSATADKIFVPANNLPYVIDKIDVFDLWITASGAADLNIVCFK